MCRFFSELESSFKHQFTPEFGSTVMWEFRLNVGIDTDENEDYSKFPRMALREEELCAY